MFGTKATVLVVAGDESVRESCAEALSDRYEVRTASDLDAAVAAVEATMVDIALVGTRLSEGSPRALVDRLRDRGTVPRMAVLSEDPFEADEEGPFDAVVSVPPTGAELEAVVCRLSACKRYDDRIERFYALSIACADLAERLDRSELASSDAYARLRAERDEARAAADDALAAVDRDDHPILVPRDTDDTDTQPNTQRNAQCEIHD